jgi:hypothetical protein
MAGYSGTPLVKKLGIKSGFNVAFVKAPRDFARHLNLPANVTINLKTRKPLDFALLFVKSEKELTVGFSEYAARLTPAGMLWVSWPKKSSGVITDLSETNVRTIGLAAGLVDVKICAVDDVWSGLKFVFRLKDRQNPTCLATLNHSLRELNRPFRFPQKLWKSCEYRPPLPVKVTLNSASCSTLHRRGAFTDRLTRRDFNGIRSRAWFLLSDQLVIGARVSSDPAAESSLPARQDTDFDFVDCK